jgi:hypothetical protein
MTPAEVDALDDDMFEAMARFMADEAKAMRRAARKRKR